MKKQDYLIIAVGIIIAAIFLVTLVTVALTVNTANAGLHMTP